MSTVMTLLRQRIRRDRVTVTIWVASTGFLALVSAIGVAKQYATDADREGIMQVAVANPTILLLRGLPAGTDLDQFIFFEIFTFLALMAALMSTFLAVRHSRAEEEAGRAELISSTPAARTAPTVATILHGVLANLALAALVALGFIAAGLEPVGSVVTGLAAGATGVVFLGVALLAAQFMRSPRGANSISVALVLVAFFLRGVGDALGTPSADGLHMTSAWPSWLSPIGWAQHVDAFGSNNLTPLLLHVALAALTVVAVFALQARRDTGASIFAGRPGRATASRSLSSSFGLAWRLQTSSLIGWAIGGAACGLFAGSLSALVVTAAESSPVIGESLQAISGPGTSIDQALISVMFSIAGMLAASAAIQAVIRMRQEESSGTAELILASPVSRVRWFVDYLVVGFVAIVAVLLSAAVVSTLSVFATGADASLARDSFAAAAAQLPAALVFLGLLALVFTLLPAITTGLGWGLLGALGFIGIFGPLLGLDEAVTRISPFANTPILFGDDIDLSGAFWMLGITVVSLVLASIVMRGRALRST